MPIQPPTRPHSANPHARLDHAIFARPTTPSAGPSSRPPPARSASMFTVPQRESEWDDAWDSSSDVEDAPEEHRQGYHHLPTSRPSSAAGSGSARGVPIPAPTRSATADSSTGVVASWTSASYQHVQHPDTSPPPGSPHKPRPILSTSKTYTEGAVPHLPGTDAAALGKPVGHSNGTAHKGSSASPLPPGGPWEIVEEAELRDEPEPMEVKSGKEAVREDLDDILNDPLELLHSLHISDPAANGSTASPSNQPFSPASAKAAKSERINRRRSVRTERRRDKFGKVLRGRQEDGGGVDLAELKRLAWSGVPNEVRPIVWQLLLNYLPLPTKPRLTTLQRKRKEYTQLVDQYFGRGIGALDQQIWHQIVIDVPRTRPGIPLWSCSTSQKALERILYVWAIRHPASGYVQGINDLVCPFFQVFLGAYIDTDPESFDVAHLPPAALSAIEADSFWCLSKLLDGIQDNYISQQPGIQRLVKRMSELVKRIDAPLAAHFEEQGVEFMQFAFRWMNCLLMREISVKCTVRMWDTYLAEGTDAFSQFHLYVCSALLVKYSDRLREMDFQEIIIFLQCLPTQSWDDHDIELLLSEAFVLKTVWQGAENHFANLPVGQSGSFGMLGR